MSAWVPFLFLVVAPLVAWALTSLTIWLWPPELRALDWAEVERWEERGWDDDAKAAFNTEPEWAEVAAVADRRVAEEKPWCLACEIGEGEHR